jgi:hypothetical protein
VPARRARRLGRAPLGAVVLALVGVALGPAAARASTVVNATFHVPGTVPINPCFPGDILNLSGDIHVVITATANQAGGYSVDDHLNSLMSGVSITTQTKYTNSETHDQSWYTGTVFPAIHTETHDFTLISAAATPNYVMHLTLHTTVTPAGVPAATVDNYHMDCTG